MRPVPTKWETSHKISFPISNQIHIVQTLSFKMMYYMSGSLPILGPKTHYFLEKFLFFYWFLKCSMSHISFSSLATCRSFCGNRSHIMVVSTIAIVLDSINSVVNEEMSYFHCYYKSIQLCQYVTFSEYFQIILYIHVECYYIELKREKIIQRLYHCC